MKFGLTLIGLMAVIFGIIAIAAIFLGWYTASLGPLEGSQTGWEIFKDGAFDTYAFPILISILGVAAVVLATVEFAGYGGTVTHVFLIVIGVAVIALAYATFADISELPSFSHIVVEMDIGMYMEIIAGAAMVMFGVLGLTKTVGK